MLSYRHLSMLASLICSTPQPLIALRVLQRTVANQALVMLANRCSYGLRTSTVSPSAGLPSAFPRLSMSSYEPLPGAPTSKLSDTSGPDRGEHLKTAAFAPDAAGYPQSGDPAMGVPAFAGGPTASSPAGPQELVEDEAAPLRFKGTATRRARTAVPGKRSVCSSGILNRPGLQVGALPQGP